MMGKQKMQRKRVLITGESGYIAGKIRDFLQQWENTYPGSYEIKQISVKDENWKGLDFSQYHILIHTAALVHKKEKPEMKPLYDRVNVLLTRELAVKAKKEGMIQFIFFSTLNVYGMETGRITKDTRPEPISLYGRSKLEAEKAAEELADRQFKVCILRPAMVYGQGCKGNYRLLGKLALCLRCFPKIDNQRSVLHIDKLCEMVRTVIEEGWEGIFVLQDEEYGNTSQMVEKIAREKGRHIWISGAFNPLVYLTFICPVKKIRTMSKKAFGTLIYEGEQQDGT